ncbi:EutP/PduV family microcompartment system protein [Sporomusa malonica]|uniref:Ethanolamine utilization protein EutP n=1 Tax=Sporomusa malonica TaxID=112901 RepID=A0A1W1YEA3_9FIRM|nr:EutP/PduV family microcompartment system protein [Sporomusa malonica]SMC34497.1 ethanolamine utilization protein EutP [Sporomusa malonica]
MIMLVGPVGAGKTSLINALNQDCRKAEKTSSICFCDGAIDTPGEYAQMPRFYSALAVTATEAKMVLMVQDATDIRITLPPGFAAMFPRPVVGVVTKIDAPGADQERAKLRLLEAGIQEPFFYVSAYTGAGLADLTEYFVRKEV